VGLPEHQAIKNYEEKNGRTTEVARPSRCRSVCARAYPWVTRFGDVAADFGTHDPTPEVGHAVLRHELALYAWHWPASHQAHVHRTAAQRMGWAD